jgi:alkaline phosphatase D
MNPCSFFRRCFLDTTLPLLVSCLALVATALAGRAATVHQGNGIKIGEVTADTAMVWTRLTAASEANWGGAKWVEPVVRAGERAIEGKYHWTVQLPPGRKVSDMQGALPGAAGAVRVTLVAANDSARKQSDWGNVDPARDHTRQFAFDGLKPATRYNVTVESRDASGAPGATERGSFRTAPARDAVAPVRFVVVTCGDYPRRDDPVNGHRIYDAMRKLAPDFFVHTGDIEYYDKAEPWANAPELARFKWNRLFALPFQRAFHREVASYFTYDDHDILRNDCWPGQTYGTLTFDVGVGIFHEQTPSGPLPYRTIRHGRDLQIWITEGRVARSANTDPDGPNKTIWGAVQKAWLFQTVAESDATFKVLLSPTPIVGPDRGNKRDNHANTGFRTEGDEVRRFIGAQPNMIVINGDRHWQYRSIDPVTGTREFGCGPSSDVHAGGYTPQPGDEAVQKFFRLKGGFIAVTVERGASGPMMTVRHHDVAGAVVHETPIAPAR